MDRLVRVLQLEEHVHVAKDSPDQNVLNVNLAIRVQIVQSVLVIPVVQCQVVSVNLTVNVR